MEALEISDEKRTTVDSIKKIDSVLALTESGSLAKLEQIAEKFLVLDDDAATF